MLRLFVLLVRGMVLLTVLLFRGIGLLAKAATIWTRKLHGKAQTMPNPRRYFWVRFGPVAVGVALLFGWPVVVASTTTQPVANDTSITAGGASSGTAADSPSATVPSTIPTTTSDQTATGTPAPSDEPVAGNTVGGDPVLAAGVILPNSARTPGSTNPAVTQGTIAQTICVVGWTTTVRPSSSVTTAIKVQQLASGYAYNGDTATGDYEEDHLISLELGGAPSSVANLWPEPYNVVEGARVKDQLENKLHTMICNGQITLATAQTAIATNWWAAYQSYIGTAAAPVPPAPAAPAPAAPAPAAPAPAPPAVTTVYPGAYCAQAGATGVTSKGTAMVCKTTSTDSHLRWRAA